MTKIIVLAMALALAAGHATTGQQTARDTTSGNTATITDEPCTAPGVLARLPPLFRDQFRGGTAVVDGTRYAICWRDAGQGAHLLFEDGDQGMIPWSDFDQPDKRGT